MAKKIEKTNAARLLDRAKIAYDLIPYTVDEDNLAATHVAEELGEDIATVLKPSCCVVTAQVSSCVSFLAIWRLT